MFLPLLKNIDNESSDSLSFHFSIRNTFFQSVFIFIKNRFHKEGICFISRDAEEKVDWVDNKKKGGENCGAILKRGTPPPLPPFFARRNARHEQ